MAKPRKPKKKGRKELRLKIDKPWNEAVKDALKRGKPPKNPK
jgi:hypothetical protein